MMSKSWQTTLFCTHISKLWTESNKDTNWT